MAALRAEFPPERGWPERQEFIRLARVGPEVLDEGDRDGVLDIPVALLHAACHRDQDTSNDVHVSSLEGRNGQP